MPADSPVERAKIQRLTLGSSGLGLPESLYISKRRKSVVNHSDKRLEIMAGGVVELNSFFNCFALCEWRRRVDLSSIGLAIAFEGDLFLSVRIHRAMNSDAVILERSLSADNLTELQLDGVFANLAVASSELISLALWSETGARVYDCDWYTTQKPKNAVKLGAIITHFNRQQWVVPAVKRLQRELLADQDFSDLVEVVVVDNSANLEIASGRGVTKITSPNFGCSGGFTRGLIHLLDQGGFSHALFMDDDAMCEIESLKRTLNIFQFDPDPRGAISGTLFCEPYFDKVHESGACWTDSWVPINHGLKLARSGLSQLTDGYRRATYGGWWYFAFPLAEDLKLPFPFFLRGDDISFGLANKFHISCPLGVACWAESFAGKDSPYLKYLDARMHTIMLLIFGTCSLRALLRKLNSLVVEALVSFRYAAADALLVGMEDALRDSSFWRENADGRFRVTLSAIFAGEPFAICSADGAPSATFRNDFRETKLRRLLRKVSLGGYLLPSALLSNIRVVLVKSWGAPNKLVFPHRKIRFVEEVSGKSWDTERDVLRAMGIFARLVAVELRVAVAYLFKRKSYRTMFTELTTLESWRSLFAGAGK